MGAGAGRRWDVALSFAGAQRDYVGQVAAALKSRKVRCFYDADEQVRLWGTHLAEELQRIYAQETAAVVVFISADYAAGEWTRMERRTAFSRAVTEAGVYVLPARFDDSDLPGLLPDVVDVDLRRHTPEQFADLVVAKLAELAGRPSPPGEAAGKPPGGVRAAAADPRRLGVHAAISMPGVPDEVPPEYVPRDTDDAEFGVRAKVAAAAERGGFVLLTGGSSVGKTRCAAEAVAALLPDWQLVHPAGPGEVAALAAAPPARAVVWLDELQNYLDGEHGLTAAVVRGLLGAPGPVMIIGTLWPDRYTAYITVPASGSADPRARERQVLALADVIRIAPAFSPAERDRARAAAARDPRLKAALETAGYGLTQTLAAAPQLVARWEDAQAAAPYAWAVLTAALDAARLGARAPLTAGFLEAAAPGYLTSRQQAEAPGDWFGRALAYATGTLHGAASALAPAAAGMGRIAGYTPADYLVQHATRERNTERVPASAWDAILAHITDPDDITRLADSARIRLLYRYATPLYRHAADAGDNARWLAELMAQRGDLGEAAQILRALAGAGDRAAAQQLARLLAWRGGPDELRAQADAGDVQAAIELAGLLVQRGDVDEAIQILRAGVEHAAAALARRLAQRGGLDEAVQILRARADAGDEHAARQLARLLAERGDLDELRARADADTDVDADDPKAAAELAWELAERGDLDELRARAVVGNWYAAVRLTEVLVIQGRYEEARRLRRFGLNPDGSTAHA
jgi:thioredoxin-like negative regulator of GroEL